MLSAEVRSRLLAPDQFALDALREATDFHSEIMSNFVPRYVDGRHGTGGLYPGSRDQFLREVFAVVVQALAVELRLSSLAGLLKGSTARQRYCSFVQSLESEWFHQYFDEKYPVVAEIADALFANASANEASCLALLELDRHALDELLGGYPGNVSDLVPLGDAHDGGHRATKVVWETGRAAILKRRSATGDALAEELIKVAGLRSLGVGVPQRVDGEGHHWQLWCEEDASRDTPEFARGLGGWLALAHFSATTDLHAENLVIAEGVVLGVDLECVGHGTPAHRSAFDNWGALEAVGILPAMVGATEESPGFNFGAFGSTGQQVAGMYLAIEQDMTDELEVAYANRTAEDTGEVGERIVATCVDELADGFLEAAARIRAVRNRWLLALEGDRTGRRHVLRATQTYGDAWLQAAHPAALLSRERYEEAIRRSLERDCPPELVAYLSQDCDKLLNRTIPIYFESADGSGVLDCEGIALTRGVDVASRRLDEEMTDSAFLSHRRSIYGASAAFAGPQNWVARERFVATESSVDLDLADLIVERIQADVLPSRRASWANVTKSLGGGWALSRSVPNLYSGDQGIIAALATAEISGLRAIDGTIVDRALLRLIDAVDDQLNQAAHVGAFDGSAGLQFTLAIAAEAGWLSAAAAREHIDNLGNAVAARIASSTSYDLLSGSAGVAALYPELARRGHLSPQIARDSITVAVDHLREGAVETPNGGLAWEGVPGEAWLGGLSHGVAGVALGLTRAADFLGSSAPRGLALRAWTSQLSLLDPLTLEWDDRRPAYLSGAGHMNAWCHGQDGIALAWREIVEKLPDQGPLMRELLDAIASRDRGAPEGDSSICHGTFGEMWIASELGTPDEFDRWARMEEREINLLSADAHDFTWMDLSLMCGKAGILWAIAARRDSNLPSPLTLGWRS